MKAILIDADQQSITETEFDTEQDIAHLIGFDTIEADDVEPGHRLFFDEECFLRGSKGRLQLDKLIPISGKAVIVGVAGEALGDATLTIEEITARTKYL
jgi:hypothetical protein